MSELQYLPFLNQQGGRVKLLPTHTQISVNIILIQFEHSLPLLTILGSKIFQVIEASCSDQIIKVTAFLKLDAK